MFSEDLALAPFDASAEGFSFVDDAAPATVYTDNPGAGNNATELNGTVTVTLAEQGTGDSGVLIRATYVAGTVADTASNTKTGASSFIAAAPAAGRNAAAHGRTAAGDP